MPLPFWNAKTFNNTIKLVDETIENKNKFEVLDDYIMEQYALSPEEINHIKKFSNK